MGINISGMAEIKAAFDAKAQEIKEKVNSIVQEAGINTEAGAKQRAPVDTGRFRAGYAYKPEELKSTVGNPVSYGVFLELGTSRMKPRPSLTPAFLEAGKKFEQDMKSIRI